MKIKFWSKNIAIKLALKEGIHLKYIHWVIIYYFRLFYFKYNSLPNIRNLLNFLNIKYNKQYNSIFLYKLFPKGVIKQVSKISNLPKNVQCF